MKRAITILICKFIRFIGKLIGKGSSLPGQIALKIYPDILKKVDLPKTIIAVTGSNGKTSTVEMIAHVLESAGKKIAYNKEGSNQIEGVASLILCSCTLSGKFKADILLIESDERYAKYTFSYFSPTHYVITNLYRDQLTRNGHPLWVYDAILPSIPEKCKLLINSDDPLVSLFAHNREDVVYFGMDKQSFSTLENTGMYDDSKYCPVCGEILSYNYYHFNHIGDYSCVSCGYKKAEPLYRITNADLESGVLTINDESSISLAFKSIYNAYNILACFAICREIGIEKEIITKSIGNYVLKSGRVVNFKLGESFGTLLTSKHENSVSYDQSIKYITQQKKPHAVIILVDAVSRKYFTSDVSWLWDIDFDALNTDNTEKIYLIGKYAYDIAVRFSYTNIDSEKIEVIQDISEACEKIKADAHKKLYVVTCFSDKDKILSKTQPAEMEEE